MRQLHPVGWHERFVASGLYLHSADGQPTGISQQWTIHALPDGAHLTRVDGQGARRDDVRLIEAWQASDSPRIERFDLQAYQSGALPVRGSYYLYPDRIDFALHVGADKQQGSLSLPDGALIDPGAAIFAGQIAADGAVPVVMFDPSTHYPLLVDLTAYRAADETVIIGSKSFPARVYNVEWKPGDAATLWLDEHDVLLKQMRGGAAIHLTQYVRVPESTIR